VEGAPAEAGGNRNRLGLRTFELSPLDDGGLSDLSRAMGIALSVEELKTIRRSIKRPLTDVELQTFGQTWSEHCIHKTFKGDVLCREGDRGTDKTVRSLFKSYIARATSELNKPWCFSVFEDNAGLVDFDRGYVAAAKVETHNHPSAVEPFGGAATGVGGVIRDILGVWGEPVATTDVLCFGPLDTPQESLPPGIKHPKYIYKGVVAGVGTYGNNMGIPTVSGGIIFDRGYTGNVVVYCGCMGILPKDLYVKDTKKGDYAVMAGGKTGRDGIHGVTFASADLSEESAELRSAVQIPNPVVEERLKRATMRIRDGRLSTGTTDLGGGGLSCATGEMAYRSGLGLGVSLDVVHLKEAGMAPWEIWVSESQERMLYSVPGKNLGEVREIFGEEEIEYCVLGIFNESKRITVAAEGVTVCDLGLELLYSPPKVIRRAELPPAVTHPYTMEEPRDLAEELLMLLSDPNIRSKEDVIRTYDHEVRGCTAVKPLQGREGGPNDAAVLKPLRDSWMGLVISCGINPFYADPYWMAAASIEEAVRNSAAVGGRRIAILDNFVWGNPERGDRMGALLRAAEACYDFAKALDVPFISGKDSLYNESQLGPVRPTLLITGMGIIPDVRKAVTIDLKREGDPVYLIGMTKDEMGGSAYLRSKGEPGGSCPRVDGSVSRRAANALVQAIDGGLVIACHDLSEGGLGVAAAEMALSSDLGLSLDLRKAITAAAVNRGDLVLFSESQSRYLVEVDAARAGDFESAFRGLHLGRLGEVSRAGDSGLRFTDLKGREHFLGSPELRKAWKGGATDGHR
jgi:phosphoribosylformylglycinamidine synthase